MTTLTTYMYPLFAATSSLLGFDLSPQTATSPTFPGARAEDVIVTSSTRATLLVCSDHVRCLVICFHIEAFRRV